MSDLISYGGCIGSEKIEFGKYKGATIDEIASTDEGLLYLDWLAGQPWLRPATKSAIIGYLNRDSIKRELDRLVE